MPHKERCSSVRIVSKNRMFAVLIVVLTLLVLELLSYVFVYHVRDNPLGNASERHLYAYFRGHELNPDYRRPFDTGNKPIHSGDGFRSDQPISIEKPDGVFRIILLGGSQAYGVGSQPGGVYPVNASLTNTQTSSHYLQVALNAVAERSGRDIKVEVINAAVVAYKAYQHLLYFNERLYLYDADLLVFVDGHNDYYSDDVERNPMLANVYAKDLLWHFNQRSFVFSVYSFTRVLGEYSYFFKFVEKSIQKLLPILNPYESPIKTDVVHDASRYEEYAKNNYVRFYQQFHALQTLYGYDMHIIVQPQIMLEDKSLLSEHDQEIYSITEPYSDKPLMLAIKEKLPNIFKQAKLDYTDLTSIADLNIANQDLYFDYTHLTAAGSQLLASAISQAIQHKVYPQVKAANVNKAVE